MKECSVLPCSFDLVCVIGSEYTWCLDVIWNDLQPAAEDWQWHCRPCVCGQFTQLPWWTDRYHLTKFTDPFFNCFLLKFMENCWQCICTVKVLTMQVVLTVWTPHWFKNLPTCWTALNFGWDVYGPQSTKFPGFDDPLTLSCGDGVFFLVKLNRALLYVADQYHQLDNLNNIKVNGKNNMPADVLEELALSWWAS